MCTNNTYIIMQSAYPKLVLEENIPYENTERLKYDNGYGGFKNNGREYVVYNENTSVWYTLKDYCKESSYTSNLSSAGTKQFVVSVKDSTGKTVSTERITVKASK